jgi:type I restriction enzyme, S subunit
MQDVSRCKGVYVESTADRLNALALSQHRLRLWPVNSLLIPKSGASVAINKRALLREPSYVVSHLAVVLPGRLLDPEFLYFFTTSIDMARFALDSSYPSLKLSDIANISIPIPPLAEQRRILGALQDLQVLSDLRISAEAISQRLVPSLFHARFSVERQGRYTALGDIADVVSGVALGRKIRAASVSKVAYLRVANVQAGRLDLSEIKTTDASAQEIGSLMLRPGDVLMTEGGDYDKLGRGCLWSGEINPCIHQNHVFRVRPDPKRLRSRFFAEYLQSAEARHYFLRCAKRTTNLASINLTQLKALPVPVVSLKEQERFEQEVESAMGLSSHRADSLSRELRQSLMSRAFSGALTRGWRERNAATVREEAAERDRILSNGVRAANTPPTQYIIRVIGETHMQRSTTNADLTVRLPRVSDVTSHLTSDHRQVLRALESLSERSGDTAPQAAVHQTAADIARTIRGNLRNDVQAVEGCLKVLDGLGLVVAVSRPQREPASGATVFGTCYRLPERNAESQSADAEAPATTEDPRGDAMAVLMTARERT